MLLRPIIIANIVLFPFSIPTTPTEAHEIAILSGREEIV